jgi:type IV pilus assembly protein PilQ|tara:strand:- start:803 stop:2515 length:1713 start_codon:yes stop_codon:yes gene_type:complete
MKISFTEGLSMQKVKTIVFAMCVVFSSVVSAAIKQETLVDEVNFNVDAVGQANVTIRFASPGVEVDVSEINNRILVVLKNSNLPNELDKRLDVSDFPTPVKFIDTQQVESTVVMEITNRSMVTYKTKRGANTLTLLISERVSKPQESGSKRNAVYKGDLLDLNFQDIEVRDVLEIIADFKSLNLVASDSVQGTITLNLNKVPWDQALDIIMRSNGLAMRKEGNILLIAPVDELAQSEQEEVASQLRLEQLAPLNSFVARIKYAKATNINELFEDQSPKEGKVGTGSSLLSSRGSVIVDERTNTIIIKDVEEKISEFKKLLSQIDIPIKQVLIEAKIVSADTDFRSELGASWRLAGGDENLLYPPLGALYSTGELGDFGTDLGLENATSALSLNYLSENLLIDLELSALESGGFGEIVSQPKVLTSDKQTASIKSGVQIPYQSATSGSTGEGAIVRTEFKDAVLQLEVTPQITPDNRVIMDLLVKQDSVGSLLASGEPSINVTEITTQALVRDGQTLVLGGIFQSEEFNGDEKVPFLGDIPGIGKLFRKELRNKEKREILIFITPKIIDSE